MEVEELKTKVDEEVKKKAEELAMAEVRALTLLRARLKADYLRIKARIEEVDKKISEVKVEDFMEDALGCVAFGEVGADWLDRAQYRLFLDALRRV